MRVTVWLVLLGVLVLMAPVGAPADEPGGVVLASASEGVVQDRVARLEALVAEQQEKIEALQTRKAESLDAARVDQVKELVREVMRDSEFRESLFPDTVQVGYDKGFYLRSADEQFLLKINAAIQFRYTYYNDQNRNRSVTPRQRYSDRSGIELERVYVGFSGHLFGPDLTYKILVQSHTDIQYFWQNYYGWVNQRFADELNLMVGVFKLPFGLQETTSDLVQMFAERGMANELFNLDRSAGVQVWGNVLDKKLTYKVAVTNGWRNHADRFGRSDPVRELDQNPAFTGRLVWHVMGELGPGESDLQYHEDPALDVGLSAGYMDANGDVGDPGILYAIPDLFRDGFGGFGFTDMRGTDVLQLGADAHFKYRGLAATWEYWLRVVNVTDTNLLGLAAPYFLATGSDSTFHQQAMQVQVGYFIIPKKLEAVTRVGAVWDIGPGGEGVWEYAGGVNYYLQGQNCKLTVDVTKINELAVRSVMANYIDLNDDLTMFRVQLQVMF